MEKPYPALDGHAEWQEADETTTVQVFGTFIEAWAINELVHRAYNQGRKDAKLEVGRDLEAFTDQLTRGAS